MKIDALTLEKFAKLFFSRFVELKDLSIRIENYVSLYLVCIYAHRKAIIKLIVFPEASQNLILKIEGTIQYGQLHFDAYKMLKELLPQSRYYTIEDNCIYIKNDYIQNICIKNNHVELEF